MRESHSPLGSLRLLRNKLRYEHLSGDERRRFRNEERQYTRNIIMIQFVCVSVEQERRGVGGLNGRGIWVAPDVLK